MHWKGAVAWPFQLESEKHDKQQTSLHCRFLHGNSGPVHDELFEDDLEVEGELPAALNGAFARNGPNPYFAPTGGYHW